ncbi:hypothetical protein EJB05_55525, partial [Eragrostis curvula]
APSGAFELARAWRSHGPDASGRVNGRGYKSLCLACVRSWRLRSLHARIATPLLLRKSRSSSGAKGEGEIDRPRSLLSSSLLETNPAMGASNSHHVLGELKITDGGKNVRVKHVSSSMQGWCEKMEDACAVVPDLDGVTSFFGVYDGHGGAEVALYCATEFHFKLCSNPNYQKDLNNAIRSVFSRIDWLLKQSNDWMESINPSSSRNWIQNIFRVVLANHWPFTKATPYIAPQYMGSTACVAVIRGTRITVANVGDSRCVISSNRKAIELSTDHKAFQRGEIKRIKKAGGRVWMDKIVILGAEMPLLGIRAIDGALATSRVIGDFAFKQNKNLPVAEQMAISDPHLRSMEITDDIEFLVMASHSIWECMTSQDVVNFVHEEFEFGETDLRIICERLVDCSEPSGENATVILLQFKDRTSTAAEGEGSRDQDIASDSESSEEQPLPDAEMVARALAFLKSEKIVEGRKLS